MKRRQPDPDYFDGAYRCTFTGKDPSSLAPLHFLETDGIMLPDGSMPAPLAFYHASRRVWQRPASRVPGFDFGTVPSRLQSVVSPLRWSRGYAMHDSAYINHGWWESPEKNNCYAFRLVTQHTADVALIRWMLADGASMSEAYAAFEGCHLRGSDYWSSHHGPFPTCQFLGPTIPFPPAPPAPPAP